MRVIHVLRKPLSEGTVASNVLRHGCGGLNIDASRISGAGVRPFQPTNHKGRWPANVILQHLVGCRCDGVKMVKGITGGTKPHRHAAPITAHGGFAEKENRPYFNHTDKDGKETVANWICEPGCPVARLDEQSGVLKSGALPSTQYTEGGRDNSSMFAGDGVFTHQGYKADSGGASRFYKMVGGGKANE